jgi:hypothetical protein
MLESGASAASSASALSKVTELTTERSGEAGTTVARTPSSSTTLAPAEACPIARQNGSRLA